MPLGHRVNGHVDHAVRHRPDQRARLVPRFHAREQTYEALDWRCPVKERAHRRAEQDRHRKTEEKRHDG